MDGESLEVIKAIQSSHFDGLGASNFCPRSLFCWKTIDISCYTLCIALNIAKARIESHIDTGWSSSCIFLSPFLLIEIALEKNGLITSGVLKWWAEFGPTVSGWVLALVWYFGLGLGWPWHSLAWLTALEKRCKYAFSSVDLFLDEFIWEEERIKRGCLLDHWLICYIMLPRNLLREEANVKQSHIESSLVKDLVEINHRPFSAGSTTFKCWSNGNFLIWTLIYNLLLWSECDGDVHLNRGNHRNMPY